MFFAFEIVFFDPITFFSVLDDSNIVIMDLMERNFTHHIEATAK